MVWDGEELPITPENAPRIRTAIRSLRDQLRVRRLPAPVPVQPERSLAVLDLESRLDAIVKEYAQLKNSYMAPDKRAAYTGIVDYAIRRLTQLLKDLAEQRRK